MINTLLSILSSIFLIIFITVNFSYAEKKKDANQTKAEQSKSEEKSISKEDPLIIKGDIFEVNNKEGLATYTGNVIATHMETVLKCDILRAYGENEKIIGDGNVNWVDKSQDLSLTCGHFEYEKKKKYALATEKPVLIMTDSKGNKTVIKSKKMEMFGEKNEAIAYDDVEITRADIKANCQKAFYYDNEEKLILTGDPIAWQKKNEFKGGKMTVYLKDERLIIEANVKTIIYPEEVPERDKGKNRDKGKEKGKEEKAEKKEEVKEEKKDDNSKDR